MTNPTNRPLAFPPEASPEAIRTRLALVRDAFAGRRVCLPEPMAPEEVEPLMALADDPDGDIEPFVRFAAKWGLSLDWLLLGDVRPLLWRAHQAKQLREGERISPLA